MEIYRKVFQYLTRKFEILLQKKICNADIQNHLLTSNASKFQKSQH